MILLISGIFVLFLGFIAPYVSHGKLPGLFFFWAGFLVVLWPGKFTALKTFTSKCSLLCLLFHAITTILLVLFLEIVFAGEELRQSYFVYYILQAGDLIINPVSKIIDYVIPLRKTTYPDGSVSWQVGFFRATLVDFLDVLFYVTLGVLIGFKLKKVSEQELK